MDNKTKINNKTWNGVADLFFEASSLPTWGPFSVGKDLKLINKIKGKTFLEICCGSGRSIKYLMDRGAKKLIGLDFSKTQIDEARKHNQDNVDSGNVELFQTPMETIIKIKPVDFVFSVYGIGWTLNPKRTFANIYSYLKPNGKFIWSWDHTFFTDVDYEKGKFFVKYSYHDEKELEIKNWKKEGFTAHICYRKTSTWFKLLREAGFEIVGYYEPKPINLARGHSDPKKYYSIQKAKLIPSSFIFECVKN